MGHYSDCAVHSAPAYPAGECDCGYSLVEQLNEGCDADKRTVKQCNALLMCLCQEAADEIERLRERLSTVTKERDELVADAKRYRWVRAYCELIEYGEPAVQEDQDNLDRAIDAAIAKLGTDKTGEV